MSLHSFKRGERLKSRKIIGQLFSEGHSFGQYPLRLIWKELDGAQTDYPVQCTVSVAKKKFPRAAHRNRIRRRVKEAYRLHKHWLYEALEGQAPTYAFMILYVAKEELSYEDIERAMKKMLSRFLKKNQFSTSTDNQK
jgi:ribonuclease P protein component